jgi:nicotinamide-nucleotide amidase
MDIDIIRRLKDFCDARGLQIATAESVTVGHLQSMLGAISGSSTFFRGGITAYNIDQKVALLNVERGHAALVDCVSLQVAEEMAKAATRLFNAHIGLATTGYAEPTDETAASGSYAYFAVVDQSADCLRPVRSGKMTSEGRDRIRTQQYFGDYVLRELIGHLGIADNPGSGATVSGKALRIERLPDGTYRVGEMIVDDLSHIKGAVRAVKQPVSVVALRMDEPFQVVTGEEVMGGNVGDWVLKGVMGEVYVCPAEAFAISYYVASA